jgi:YARHG domain
MKKILFFLLLCFSHASFANDGSFYAVGNTLIPLKETVIRLKKEILSLSYEGGFMRVNIYFEFFNPAAEKELTVGFVTPPAAGDVTDEEEAHPQVKDFFVQVNDRLLAYKIARMNGTGFKVSEELADGDDFVYYFNVKFKKGITIIRHSYAYRGGMSVENIYEYAYRLTTGTSWAGGAIEDFELNIQMENDRVFGVPFRFTDTKADWQIIGIGRLGKTPRYDAYDSPEVPDVEVVFIKNGYLQLKAKNFRPQSDIEIIIPQAHNEITWWCDKGEENDFFKLNDLDNSDSTEAIIRSFSDRELRLYKNLDYARNGYDFKDSALKKIFSKYIWYIPDPSFKLENATEKYLSKKYMDLIIAEEKRRKI